MKNILISNPNSYDVDIYMPYIYGLLRRMCDINPKLEDGFNWYKPLYRNTAIKDIVKNYDIESIDVLGLSCYTWNRELNYEVAKTVKKVNPNCIVLAGGPDPDTSDPDFFSIYPLIDIVVKREADHALPLVLEQILDETYNFKDIPGLVIKDFGDTGPVNYGRIYPDSVYIRYEDIYTEIAAEIAEKGGKPIQLLEGDRGCPYSCAYCNKGGYSYKDASFTPLDIIFQDIDWGGRNGIYYVDIVNSNFGRFDRDLDIAKKLVETKELYGYPEIAFYSAAKTHAGTIAEIIKLFSAAGMLEHHIIALQSTNTEALNVANRVNMPLEEYKILSETAATFDIPACSQFIVGLPGDNYEGVKQSFVDVMDIGLADNFMIFLYQILTNSTAYTKEYREEWDFETVMRHSQRQRRKKKLKTSQTSVGEFLVSCKTFDKDEYISMWHFAASIIAYVGCNITKLLSVYLNLNHNISYYDFYSDLIEDFSNNPKYPFMLSVNNLLRHNQEQFVYSGTPDTAFYEFEHPQLTEYHAMFEFDEFLLISITLNFDEFRKEFSEYILEKYADVPLIKSILDFQMDMIITKDYNPDIGKSIKTDYDWVDYFHKVKRSIWSGVFEPEKKDIELFVNQSHCGPNKEWPLDWNEYEGVEKTHKFVEAIIGTIYKRTERNAFDMNSMEKL